MYNSLAILICLFTGFFAILNKNNPLNLLALSTLNGIFLYIPTVIFLFNPEFELAVNNIHISGYSQDVFWAGSLVLFLIFLFLSKISIQYFIPLRSFDFLVLIGIFIAGIFSILGYSIQNKVINPNIFKNLIANQAMFYLTIVGYFALLRDKNGKRFLGVSLIALVAAVVSLSLVIELLEIILSKTWAITVQYDGVIVRRAAGILFNPNLMAFFLSLISVFLAFEYQKNKKLYILFFLIIAFVDLYLTGSRSNSYLLLFILFVQFVILRSRLHFFILLLLPLTYLIIWIIGILLSVFDFSFIESFINLGERFGNGIVYVLVKICSAVAMDIDFYIPPEINTSINGRLKGEGSDSGILLLNEQAGYFSFISIGLYYIIALYLFVITWMKSRTPIILYSFLALVFCMASNFFIKFQVYPVWLFISVTYIIFLYNCRILYIK